MRAARRHEAGTHELRFDDGALSCGVYLVRLVTPDGEAAERLALVKQTHAPSSRPAPEGMAPNRFRVHRP